MQLFTIAQLLMHDKIVNDLFMLGDISTGHRVISMDLLYASSVWE